MEIRFCAVRFQILSLALFLSLSLALSQFSLARQKLHSTYRMARKLLAFFMLVLLAGSFVFRVVDAADAGKEDDDDDDDDFDASELAARVQQQREQASQAAETGTAAELPPEPTAPIPKTKDYPWSNTDLTTYIWRTVNEGNMENLKKIIRLQPEAVHVRSEDGRGALWWAYEYGRKDMVDYLLHWGSSPTDKDADGNTPSDLAPKN